MEFPSAWLLEDSALEYHTNLYFIFVVLKESTFVKLLKFFFLILKPNGNVFYPDLYVNACLKLRNDIWATHGDWESLM